MCIRDRFGGCGNGHVERLVYNGAEKNAPKVYCEVTDVLNDHAVSNCPSWQIDEDGKVDAKLYKNQLQGKAYRQSVYEEGNSTPQSISETFYEIQVFDRGGEFKKAIHTNVKYSHGTKDDVTTVAVPHYNEYGQANGSDTYLNKLDQHTEEVFEEKISKRSYYGWQSQSADYRDKFETTNTKHTQHLSLIHISEPTRPY